MLDAAAFIGRLNPVTFIGGVHELDDEERETLFRIFRCAHLLDLFAWFRVVGYGLTLPTGGRTPRPLDWLRLYSIYTLLRAQ